MLVQKKKVFIERDRFIYTYIEIINGNLTQNNINIWLRNKNQNHYVAAKNKAFSTYFPNYDDFCINLYYKHSMLVKKAQPLTKHYYISDMNLLTAVISSHNNKYCKLKAN